MRDFGEGDGATAGGIDLRALERLTSAGSPDDGWRLLEEVERAAREQSPMPALQQALQQAPLIRAPAEALSVFDLEPVAKSRLPIGHYGYMASGVDDDGTLRANREGFSQFQLRARRLVNVRDVDMSVTIFGERWETPIFVCPTGSQQMYDPEGVAAVRGRIPVLIDGGFRRGSDMVKALALGATAVGIGRPYLWGLASFGQAGVEAVLTLMRRELLLSMRQVGMTSLRQLGREYVVTRGGR